MKPRRFIGIFILGVSGFFIAWHTPVSAIGSRPRIAIIIDDMGNSLGLGAAALELPSAVTYSFALHTRRLASLASRRGKEIMLCAPMQALSGDPLGAAGLTVSLDRREVERRFSEQLAAIPGISGVNNHMCLNT